MTEQRPKNSEDFLKKKDKAETMIIKKEYYQYKHGYLDQMG